MGAMSAILADTGDTFRLWDYGGNGKALAVFLSGLWAYCINASASKTKEYLLWFEELEEPSTQTLCHFSEITLKASIYADVEFDRFGEDEYEKFIAVYGNDITKESFIASVKHYRNAWTNIDLIIDFAQTFLAIFKEVKPRADDPWYDPQYTFADFEALEKLLLHLKNQKVKSIRIHVE